MGKKSNLKDFFKPEIGKTIVVYALFLITVIVSISWPTPPIKTFRVVEVTLLDILIPTRFRLQDISLVLSWVVYWYLLSCPIVWIHKKMNK